MNIYLDIDGVILANDKQKAKHADDFLKYFVENHDVYWLTTHCHGDSEYTVNHLAGFFSPETTSFLKRIKPTDWNENKTEAIDFTKPFVWFEDFIFDSEKEELVKHDALNRWIVVDLVKNVDQLKEIIDNFPK